MSFVLNPPVPGETLDFRRSFAGVGADQALELTRRREALNADALRLVQCSGAALGFAQALERSASRYHEAWLDFAREHVMFVGAGRVVVRPGTTFVWHDRVLQGATRTCDDPSILFESSAVTLVLVAALQRQAIDDSTSGADSLAMLDRAVSTLESARQAFLVERMRPLLPVDRESDPREPRLLDATFVASIAAALRGQRAFVASLSSARAVGEQWRAVEHFEAAAALMPGERVYAGAAGRMRARAFRATGEALRGSIVEGLVSPSYYGLVVALFRARAQLSVDGVVDADEAAEDEYERVLRENTTVYDRTVVPAPERMGVETRGVEAVFVEAGGDTLTIVVPGGEGSRRHALE